MKSIVLVMVALGCGLVAAVGVLQYLDSMPDMGEVRMKDVLVANRDININEVLDEGNVEITQWPSNQIPPGALTSMEDVDSKYARIRLYPGEPLMIGKIMGPDDGSGSLKVPVGYRVVSVRVTSESSVSNLVEPGDRVDVIAVVRAARETPLSMAKTILKAVRVFAVNSEMAKTFDDDKSMEDARTVSLLLQPSQVEKLMMAADLGTIRMALRSPEDADVDETEGCTIERILGRGDVAEEVSSLEKLVTTERRLNVDSLSGDSANAIGPPHWMMVVQSPRDQQQYRWSSAGQSPVRMDEREVREAASIPSNQDAVRNDLSEGAE